MTLVAKGLISINSILRATGLAVFARVAVCRFLLATNTKPYCSWAL